MTPEFNKWWTTQPLYAANPYPDGSEIYWAYEGWMAGQQQERQALMRILESFGAWNKTAQDIAEDIRLRGEK